MLVKKNKRKEKKIETKISFIYEFEEGEKIHVYPISVTSRPPRVLEEDGRSYWFTDRPSMETDILEHRYLEHGEHGGHLYGTRLESVRELIRAGKMCVLDCSPAALKILHNSTEFMPYVIFIAAPGMEQLKSLYDLGRSTGASNRNLTVSNDTILLIKK